MTNIEIIAIQAKEIIGLKRHKAELLKRVKDSEYELRNMKKWFDELQESIGYWGHYAHTIDIIKACYTRTSNCPGSPVDPSE